MQSNQVSLKVLDPDVTLPNEDGNLGNVKVCDITETIKYLGAPIGIRRLAKLKFNSDKTKKSSK